MELRIAGRRLRIYRSSVIGLGLVAFGIAALFLAYQSQSSIDRIGATTDPARQNEISTLEGQRDLYLVTAVGTVFLGLFAVAMLGEPSGPIVVSENQMIGSARITNEMLMGFSLSGNSLYMPPKHGLTREKMFVTTASNTVIPPSALSDDLILSPGKDGSTPGILLEPSGFGLLSRIEKELDATLAGSGLETAEGTLQILKHGYGMMKDFHFKEREGKTVLRVEYAGLLGACRQVRKELPDTCRQAQCIGCSCLLTAAARASGKMVSVEEVDNMTDTVVFTLNLRDW